MSRAYAPGASAGPSFARPLASRPSARMLPTTAAAAVAASAPASTSVSASAATHRLPSSSTPSLGEHSATDASARSERSVVAATAAARRRRRRRRHHHPETDSETDTDVDSDADDAGMLRFRSRRHARTHPEDDFYQEYQHAQAVDSLAEFNLPVPTVSAYYWYL
ncbi:hypothetical protein SPI_06294 [Niveomyces insectorum RCEF 264]|uniref:Uncharacterized protein n=1 Tax=Niveomyces insectorum RCEF 264 TaxID=1081102 RepID=A0A167RZQ5_9HYPO|nr:hypothetical protein SPI_06294 [Niveomyces insectorum RCEF 264]